MSNKCYKCHEGCSTCSGPLASDCMSCSDSNLHLDENNTCVPCCHAFQGSKGISESLTKNCCQCDETNMKCLQGKDLEYYGNKKRRSNGRAHAQIEKGIFKTMSLLRIVFFIVDMKENMRNFY